MLNQDYRDMLSCLRDETVEFLLVGAWELLRAVILSGLAITTAQAQRSRLPNEIRVDLTRYAGKWRFVANQASSGKSCVDVLTGDLDGDGQRDYAVYVLAGNGPTEQRQRLIVYLRKEAGYVRRTLSAAAPTNDLCLHLFKRGDKDYNYETQKDFRYQHDTVGLFSEKGGSSYVFWRGRFYRITTSD